MIAALRHALRSLRRSPAFTFTVIATLGIGIGLNAAIFAVVDCVLLRPLGYHDADRIVSLETHFVDENRSTSSLGGGDYNDIAHQIRGLEATAYYQVWPNGISVKGAAVQLPIANVSPRFGEVMGVQPLVGRLFLGDDADGQDVLVGAAFARQHFGSAAAAIGETIRYNDVSRPIVGVLPDGFSFPNNAQVWMELPTVPANVNRTAYNQHAIGKRKAGVSPAQLAAEFATFSSQLQRAYPENSRKKLESIPLQERLVGDVRPTLNLLMGSVAVILLIVCANITHLQLVHATRQIRSITIRTALGASRAVLGMRALLEAALLALAGCLVAIIMAVPALRLLVRLAPPDLPRLEDIHLNADVFLFSALLSVAVMTITALLPVWRSWHIDPAAALRQDASRGTEDRGSARFRDGLIVAEVALTLTLSVAAILLTRQLMGQARQDLGFSPESLVTLDTHDVGTTRFPDEPTDKSPAAQAAYKSTELAIAQARLNRLDDTLNLVAHTPGVLSAGAMDGAPMGFGSSNVGYAVKGRQVFGAPFLHLPIAYIYPVTPGLLATLGVPLLSGRALEANDRLGAPPVLLINQTLARTIFPKEDPIGKQIMCGFDRTEGWWTIVGVVGDIRSDSPAEVPTPNFYVPIAQHPGNAGDMQIIARTGVEPGAMTETLRKVLLRTHPEIAVKATTMRQNIGETQRAGNFRSILFESFAAVSILLAAIGMYGVTAYSATQRRFEFGLRVALGANRTQVLRMVLGRATACAALGIGIGIALSLTLARVLSSVIGRLPAFDFIAYALASLAVLAIALLATLLPAQAAAHVDPMTVLRSE
jgi:putative ABC transport system permease protein